MFFLSNLGSQMPNSNSAVAYSYHPNSQIAAALLISPRELICCLMNKL